jgi:hypothetical protein
VVGTVKIAGPGSPKGWGKDDHGQEKKDAGYFKPQGAADAAKRAQKASDALGNTARCAPRSVTGAAALGRSGSPLSRRGAFAGGDPSGDPQADAQNTTDGVRFHSIYDGSSVAIGQLYSKCRTGSHLPSSGAGSKVDKSRAATRATLSRWPPLPEVSVTSRLRELIQQLGEAIHESVIESEQIAGVVQDIRKHGFDVLLMLEATIGLNEVGAKEAGDVAEGGEPGSGEEPFTQNDLHFLRSLRISIEGDEAGAEADTE